VFNTCVGATTCSSKSHTAASGNVDNGSGSTAAAEFVRKTVQVLFLVTKAGGFLPSFCYFLTTDNENYFLPIEQIFGDMLLIKWEER